MIPAKTPAADPKSQIHPQTRLLFVALSSTASIAGRAAPALAKSLAAAAPVNLIAIGATVAAIATAVVVVVGTTGSDTTTAGSA